jgi:hypothetical protein
MAELYSNWATTTLASAVTSSGQTTFTVTDGSLFPLAGIFRITIGSEIVAVTAVSGTNNTSWTVTRGTEGTTAATYTTGTLLYSLNTAATLDGIRSGLHTTGLNSLITPVSNGVKPGDLFFPNDSNYTLLRWSASGWQYYLNGRLMSPPLASMFVPNYLGVQVYGIPTVTNASGNTGAMTFYDPNTQTGSITGTTNNPQYSFRTTTPTPPYTLTTAIIPNMSSNGGFAGIGLNDTRTGSMIVFGVNSSKYLRLYKWNNYGTYNSDYYNAPEVMQYHGPVSWLRIADDGTNYIYSTSMNGQTWVPIITASRTDFLTNTADSLLVVVGDSPVANTPVGCTYLTWEIS